MATNNQKENVKPNEEKKKTRVPSGLLGIFTFLGLIALIKGLGSTSKIKSAFHEQTVILLFILSAVLVIGSFVIYEIRKILFFMKESQEKIAESPIKQKRVTSAHTA